MVVRVKRRKTEAELLEIEAFIREGILEARFVPGQRLVEIDLMDELGATRSAIREALRRIATDGLVQIERNRGAAVRKISRKEVSDILDILDDLSIFVIRKAISRVHEPRIRKLVEQSRAASKRFRKEALQHTQAQDYLYENARFWQSMTDAADNPTLAEVKFKLQLRLFCIQRQGLVVESTRRQWIAHHEEILDAILDGDVQRAVKLVPRASAAVRAAIMALPDVAFASPPATRARRAARPGLQEA
jgi:DNA-binding GntR family transcriptional regulator